MKFIDWKSQNVFASANIEINDIAEKIWALEDWTSIQMNARFVLLCQIWLL